MPTECERLIAETLRLDGAVVSTHEKLKSRETHSPLWWKAHEDWCEIRDERDGHAIRSAHRLARMLQVAIKELERNHEREQERAMRAGNACLMFSPALAEIEKIARGES